MADFPPAGLSGRIWTHYALEPKDWSGVTDTFTFEDEGHTFNLRTATPPTRWSIVYEGLSSTQADYLSAMSDAYGIHLSFTFLDKAGTTQTGIRFESFQRSHDRHLGQIITVSMVLVKYP